MDCLFVITGNDKGCRFELTGETVVIGRGLNCSIRLNDVEISRRHVELRKTEKGWLLADLESSNGVYINGAKVREQLLAIGDQIQIGRTLLAYSPSAAVPSREEMNPVVDFARSPQSQDQSRIIHSYKQDQGRDLFTPDYSTTLRSEWFQKARAHLNLIYHTTLAVSQTLDIDRLLHRIMDMIFDWVQIDRGCILLYNQETNTLIPKVLRRRNPEPKGPLVIDQSIADYVVTKREGILTNDADQAFLSSDMAGQGVREAICVPLLGRYGLVGILYIDIMNDSSEGSSSSSNIGALNSSGVKSLFIPPVAETGQTSPFTIKKTETDAFIKIENMSDAPSSNEGGHPVFLTRDHLKLMFAIGHQAALAVEDTQYYLAMLQSERLAAVGQTVAVLSHHIKNILQGIQGGSYLIEKGLSAHDETMVGKGWGIVEKNQGRISNLILDMLTFSKERTPVFESRNINKVIRDVDELMERRAADFHVALIQNLDETIPKFYFDSEQIHRALTNLVTNAIDAVRNDPRYQLDDELDIGRSADETNVKDLIMTSDEGDRPKGADSALETRHAADKTGSSSDASFLSEDGAAGGRVEISSRFNSDAKTVVIQVDDNGPGVPPEWRDDLFRPFFSKNKSSGTGLGLAVTHKIVQEHKGNIRITESPWGGARFTIELPFIDKNPEEETD